MAVKIDIDSLGGRFLLAFGTWILRIWESTLRYEVDDRGGILSWPIDQRGIGAVWHNRLLVLPFVLRRFVPNRPGAALISASRDGAWIAAIVERIGYETVRGSSSRLGATAILQLSGVLDSGCDVVITPDGPRGPPYKLGPGIILLAQKTGAAVVPLNLEYSSCWRVNNWDRFIFPRPFSKVRVIFGSPHQVAPTTTDAEFESERLRLENAMMSLVERR